MKVVLGAVLGALMGAGCALLTWHDPVVGICVSVCFLVGLVTFGILESSKRQHDELFEMMSWWNRDNRN